MQCNAKRGGGLARVFTTSLSLTVILDTISIVKYKSPLVTVYLKRKTRKMDSASEKKGFFLGSKGNQKS